MAIRPTFTAHDIKLISDSLPDDVNQRRLKLLPQILREWSQTELAQHLSREPLTIIRKRGRQVEAVEKRARDLLEALNALDELGQFEIVRRIVAHETPFPQQTLPARWYVEQAELTQVEQELEAVRAFLTRLGRVEPSKTPKLVRRNVVAYLVLKDIAAIFEWLTGKKPTRQVDRDASKDTGPFWEFAGAIWPRVFRNRKHGLSAAIKNWAYARKHFGELSALIANIAMRHPTWGVFTA